jgi:hypothetical protein
MCVQAARERDPDSKRVRFKPNSVHGRSCCGGVNVRWLAAGFILGMLMFATLSVLQVHADGMLDWTVAIRPVHQAQWRFRQCSHFRVS